MINSTDEEIVKPDTPPELYSCPDKQSRSLREYDEELHNLRKENFNLKLRIFFLEGKPQGTNICPSTGPKTNHEQFSNQNLKVENKELRKELQEKQNLLHEAAHAIEVLENSLKRQQELNNITITELADEIKYIEVTYKLLRIFVGCVS
ncbi:CDK5 regulatory subunit-associated protein 2-like isoform X1 [Sitodiplosis mosellana]|uniref:CDK5 regulatory subunit-associated protein 2-like isoform X1 n=1 Tax=Sitodiplosis mosellana TaxID=263140 RepID=UPI0024447178|nr:CDK5 regulatory subunit-associated protein 2-like isoform X1 [Sitodiplosis mosellana]